MSIINIVTTAIYFLFLAYNFPYNLILKLYTILGLFSLESEDLPYLKNPLCHFQVQFNSVQSLSHIQIFASPRTATCQASLFITNSRSLPKLMSIESVMPSKHVIFCCPLLLLLSIFPNVRDFSNELGPLIRWPKYWSFNFNISPSNEHSGLISHRMECLDCIAVQGTLKSLLQHHSSKASIRQCSAFFIVQLSHPYMTARKATALTRWTFVGNAV